LPFSLPIASFIYLSLRVVCMCHTTFYHIIYLTHVYAIAYPIYISSLTSLCTFNRRLPCGNINDTPVYSRVKCCNGILCACGLFVVHKIPATPLASAGTIAIRSVVTLAGVNNELGCSRKDLLAFTQSLFPISLSTPTHFSSQIYYKSRVERAS